VEGTLQICIYSMSRESLSVSRPTLFICLVLYLFNIYHITGSPKWIQLTKAETQLIYTALQSSDVEEIIRVLSEQQVCVLLSTHLSVILSVCLSQCIACSVVV